MPEPRTGGYSLTELLAVVSIIAMLLLSAGGLFHRQDSGQAERAARQVMDDLRVARMRAVSRQQVTTLALDPAARVYTVTPNGFVRRLPREGTVAPASLTTVSFDVRGALTTPAPVSFSVTAGGKQALVTVTPVGQIGLVLQVAP